MFEINQFRVLHVAVSMTPSLGVIKQMEYEQQAAKELGLTWDVVLHTGEENNSSIIHFWPNLPKVNILKYLSLRKNFYTWLMNVESKYDLIILRHSVHDIFENQIAKNLGHKILTMHHTFEEEELRSSPLFGLIRSVLEKYLGSGVIKKTLGVVAVTSEILKHQSARELTSRVKYSYVYPNGVSFKQERLPDSRSNIPELIFVASYFSDWHGLDLLIGEVERSQKDFRLHLVGRMSGADEIRCKKDKRIIIHGTLNNDCLNKIVSRSWCGLSSFALSRKGMREGSGIKVREYLSAGVPVYAGHRDVGLPKDFRYFKHGPVDLDDIISFANKMRYVSRDAVINESKYHISKTILLETFYKDLKNNLAPFILSVAGASEKNETLSNESKVKGVVALTGATGFVGKSLIPALLADGWSVRVLTRNSKKFENVHGVDIFEGDLAVTEDWSSFVSGVDILINAAAELNKPELMMPVNVEGPQKLLKAAIAAGVGRWIQLSSVGAYGQLRNGLVDELTPEIPVGQYEKTKTLFDQLLIKQYKKLNFDVCIIRPSNIYGPQMVNQSLFLMARMISRGLFTYIGPFGSSANYVHVDDVVRALILCAKSKEAAGKTYIVSNWTTFENLVISMSKALEVMPPSRRISLVLALFLSQIMRLLPGSALTKGRVLAMSSHVRYSTLKIERELGWRASVPVGFGVFELIRSYFGAQKKSVVKQSNKVVKNVLIITYDWPPRNSIATHRPYSWAKYWSADGYDVTVLTAKKKFFDAPLDLNLPSLERVRLFERNYAPLISLPTAGKANLSLIFVPILKKIKNALSYLVGHEFDVRNTWAKTTQDIYKEIGANFDVVVSTYGPASPHIIAANLKKINPSIYWVADYRDLWSLNSRNRSSRIAKFLISKKELAVVRSVDMFITVSKELGDELQGLVKKRPFVIYNGYDIEPRSEFYDQIIPEKKNTLRLIYTGRIYPGKRSPLHLIKAIESLLDEKKIQLHDVVVEFYGVNSNLVFAELGAIKYPGIIKDCGYVSRDYAIKLQQSADLLLLLESGDSDSKGFLTGKIFEYLAAGKPIISLGSAKDSSISRLLNETGCGKCYEDNVEMIAADLLRYLQGINLAWYRPNFEIIKQYSREYQAKKLMNTIIEEIAS